MSVSCYLDLEFENGKIEGSCTTAGHEKQIQLISWSHAFSQQATGAAESAFGGMATSYADHQPLVISKYLDKSSGAILKACWRADYVKKATIMSYRASGKDSVDQSTCYLKVEAENGIVTDYHINDGGDVATEQFTIKYQKVTYTFTPTDNETGEPGSAEPVTHDLSKNQVS
jgi:type VI secretion system secreted protein Hcp